MPPSSEPLTRDLVDAIPARRALTARRLPLATAAAALTVVVACLVLVGHARAYWDFTVDDAYITLRYSRHLAEGFGPEWNLEGPRAEGYTAPLWMVLLALPHLVGADAVVFA
ncbi:hypothetical protein EON77_05610, partial [bacterium]